ncbi:hypothetical protein FRP1_09920 [Pseudonocardia sp. EC080625-04]|uniref:hypothetical protein n=1 Tax=Pseudonocardia sp. EC080625-04 TaxID=1096868 RepID=UPI0006CB39AB|nr:hypothetical protein [Pseudonocardia sp. EC080625-04]ALE73318.1 hypothetical protein FRP1_09920 [Pseudonocardia sp. EC080625-04]
MSTRTRQTGATAAPPPATTTVRPGWGEIVAGLVLMGIAVYRIPPILGDHAAALGPWYGIALLALPAVAALGGFTTSARARVRSWSAVGVRRASARAVLAGAGAGVAALALTVAVTAVLGAAGSRSAGPGRTRRSWACWSSASSHPWRRSCCCAGS